MPVVTSPIRWNMVLEIRAQVQSKPYWPQRDILLYVMADRNTADRAPSKNEIALGLYPDRTEKDKKTGKPIPTHDAKSSASMLLSYNRKREDNGCMVIRQFITPENYSVFMSVNDKKEHRTTKKKTSEVIERLQETVNKEDEILGIPFKQRQRMIEQMLQTIDLKHTRKDRKRKRGRSD